ncbi:ATP-binding protein [Archangium violaceum]|uniref:sensor histidine kinase n=1 Tax=Archangium violaceum TaxID=83451 RepID=UPI002B2E25BE|nr:ATP-binding protein [Archangium gephyra]
MSSRRRPPPAPDTGFTGSASLLRKYQELLRKHETLVHRLAHQNAERISTWKLSSWALETSASGLALMRDGVLQIANKRWHALARAPAKQGGWRRLSPGLTLGPLLPHLQDVAQEESHAVLAMPEPGQRITRYRREDGGMVLELRSERVGGPRQQLVLEMAHDVTALVRAEEELEQARETLIEREHLRALGDMASGVAHDLSSTLNAMRLRLELIQRDTEFAERQRAHLDALVRIVSDARERVGRLHDFAHQRPEEAPPGQPVQLADVVREAVEIARGDIEDRAVRQGLAVGVEVEVPPLPRVSGSAADLRYVFINLLLNARDAMPRGGAIRVRGREDEGQVILTVEDEGTGIPPEHLHSIFRPFFTTKGNQGTGLGLAMAYGVISRAGGTITAANRPEGGALFTLTFPALPVPAPETKPAPKSAARPTRKLVPKRKPRPAR